MRGSYTQPQRSQGPALDICFLAASRMESKEATGRAGGTRARQGQEDELEGAESRLAKQT